MAGLEVVAVLQLVAAMCDGENGVGYFSNFIDLKFFIIEHITD